MTLPPESKAMTEIREIREALSQTLKELTPEERTEYIHKKAVEFEKKHGLNLPYAGIDDEKTA